MLTPPPPDSQPASPPACPPQTDKHGSTHASPLPPPPPPRKVCCERWRVFVQWLRCVCPHADSSVENSDGELRCLGDAVKLSEQGEEVESLSAAVTDMMPLCYGLVSLFGCHYCSFVFFLNDVSISKHLYWSPLMLHVLLLIHT